MRILGWVVALSLLGSMAYSQSLADVAKREHERREKLKKEGSQIESKVIRDEDLAAAPGKDAKGTLSPGTGFTSGRSAGGTAAGPKKPVPAVPSPSPSAGGERVSEVDALRSGARQRLESSYEAIAGNAWSFVQAVRDYYECAGIPNRNCASQAARAESLGVSVAIAMDQAEDAARQGWLNPGEVRDARQRYGMDDAFWDQLVRYVRQYKR